MAKKKDFDVWLPPITIEEIDVNTLQNQVVDYWHALVQTDAAFKYTKGEGVVVFVLDTTYKTAHPDLNANILHEYAKSFTDDTTDEDLHGHGIHCMGIVGAVDNGIGVIGAAPNVKLVPVRVLNNQGSGSWNWIVNGIRYACDVNLGQYQNYKRVISMSLGGPSGSSLVQDALKYARDKNVYVLAAAGNSGFDGNRDTVNYPGAYDELCITVASVSKLWKPSYFSSGGKAVDLAAFGESIYSTYKNNGYARLSGTSMATPMAAGLVALILSKYSDITLTRDQLETYYKKYAKDIEEAGEDDKTGAGVPIMPPYMVNSPDGSPNDPDDPDQPDDPQDPVKPERTLNFNIQEDLMISWSPNTSRKKKEENEENNAISLGCTSIGDIKANNNFKVKILEIDISMVSKIIVENEYDSVLKETLQFFSNYGFILKPDSDLRDVAYWAMFFYKMIVGKQLNREFNVDMVLVQDAQGRKLKLYYDGE